MKGGGTVFVMVFVFVFIIIFVIAFVIVLKCCPQEALKGEGDMRPSGDGEPMGSLLIYPGCKVVLNDNDEEGLNDYDDNTFSAQVYLFEEPNFEGDFVEYTGPAVMPDPKYIFGVSQSTIFPMKCKKCGISTCSHSGLVVPETTLSFALALISGLANRFEIRKQKKSSHACIFVKLS